MAAAVGAWVEAGPFRAHLQHLMAVGDLTAGEVATLTGVSPRLATSLAEGRHGRPVRRISPDAARALLRVSAADARAVRLRQVPAAEFRVRLRRLRRRGWELDRLAAHLGVTTEVLADLAAETTSWCSALLAVRLVTLSRAAVGVELPDHPGAVAA